VGAGGTVSCSDPVLGVGDAVFTLVVQVGPSVTTGTVLSNTATASSATSDPNPGNESGTATTTVAASADISLTLTDAPDPVAAGGDLVYTLTASNAGPSAAASASLSDTLPTGTTFQSLASPVGWSCTTPAVGASGSVTCTNASFAPGTAVFTLTVRVAFGLASGTVLTNSPTLGAATTDPNPGDTSPVEMTVVKALDHFTVAPCRAVDTRAADGPPLAANATRAFQLSGLCGIPAGAKAVAVNLTVVGPQAQGHLEVFPGDQATPPGTSVLNFGPGQTRANNAILLLATDGSGTVKVLSATSGSVDLVIDVAGYFE